MDTTSRNRRHTPTQESPERNRADERADARQDYVAGADGEQDVTAGPGAAEGQLGPDEISEPDEVVRNADAKRHLESEADHSERQPQRDHSEREWGGDQDIDTAGMVPGNKATDGKEPTGF